jgi:hypothetical protein
MQLIKQFLLVALMYGVERIVTDDIDLGREFRFCPAGLQDRENLIWSVHWFVKNESGTASHPETAPPLDLSVLTLLKNRKYCKYQNAAILLASSACEGARPTLGRDGHHPTREIEHGSTRPEGGVLFWQLLCQSVQICDLSIRSTNQIGSVDLSLGDAHHNISTNGYACGQSRANPGSKECALRSK